MTWQKTLIISGDIFTTEGLMKPYMYCSHETHGINHPRRKYPDRLADSCKCLSVNQMAAGSRLSWCIMDFFLQSATFQT